MTLAAKAYQAQQVQPNAATFLLRLLIMNIIIKNNR